MVPSIRPIFGRYNMQFEQMLAEGLIKLERRYGDAIVPVLAAHCHVKPDTVRCWLRGAQRPSTPNAFRLIGFCDALGVVDIKKLPGFSDNPALRYALHLYGMNVLEGKELNRLFGLRYQRNVWRALRGTHTPLALTKCKITFGALLAGYRGHLERAAYGLRLEVNRLSPPVAVAVS